MLIDFNLHGVSAFGTILPLDSQVEKTYAHWLPAGMKDVATVRQQEFIAGRFCAVQAAKQIGHELSKLPVASTREPVWPDGLKGSITHSKQLAIGCVSLSENLESIGIDAEEMIKPGLRKDIEKTIANDVELFLLEKTLPEMGLTILFSAKESLYKALFPLVRTFIDFKEVVLTELDSEKMTFVLELKTSNPKLVSHLGTYHGSYKIMGETIVTVVYIPKAKGKHVHS